MFKKWSYLGILPILLFLNISVYGSISSRKIRSIKFYNHLHGGSGGHLGKGKHAVGGGGNGTSFVNFGAPKEAVYSSIPTFSMCFFCFQLPNPVFEKKVTSSYNHNNKHREPPPPLSSSNNLLGKFENFEKNDGPAEIIDPFDIDGDIFQNPNEISERSIISPEEQESEVRGQIPNILKMIEGIRGGRAGLGRFIKQGTNSLVNIFKNTVG